MSSLFPCSIPYPQLIISPSGTPTLHRILFEEMLVCRFSAIQSCLNSAVDKFSPAGLIFTVCFHCGKSRENTFSITHAKRSKKRNLKFKGMQMQPGSTSVYHPGSTLLVKLHVHSAQQICVGPLYTKHQAEHGA
jgi:hypothetical protein